MREHRRSKRRHPDQQVQVFNEALNAEANYRLFVENNLRRALQENELEVYYQPKLSLRNGQLQGLEALLRWSHPERGEVSPGVCSLEKVIPATRFMAEVRRRGFQISERWE